MEKVLLFTASWCGPCKVLRPKVTKLLEESTIPGWMGIIDVDGDPAGLVSDYRVASVPTLVVVRDGEQENHVGAPAILKVLESLSANT